VTRPATHPEHRLRPAPSPGRRRPIRFPDLRHAYAALLLSRGVSPRMVMDTLGHSQIAVTMNTYGHVIPAMQREAAGHMDAALGDLDERDSPDED
jgi:integrase